MDVFISQQWFRLLRSRLLNLLLLLRVSTAQHRLKSLSSCTLDHVAVLSFIRCVFLSDDGNNTYIVNDCLYTV